MWQKDEGSLAYAFPGTRLADARRTSGALVHQVAEANRLATRGPDKRPICQRRSARASARPPTPRRLTALPSTDAGRDARRPCCFTLALCRDRSLAFPPGPWRVSQLRVGRPTSRPWQGLAFCSSWCWALPPGLGACSSAGHGGCGSWNRLSRVDGLDNPIEIQLASVFELGELLVARTRRDGIAAVGDGSRRPAQLFGGGLLVEGHEKHTYDHRCEEEGTTNQPIIEHGSAAPRRWEIRRRIVGGCPEDAFASCRAGGLILTSDQPGHCLVAPRKLQVNHHDRTALLQALS